MSGKEEIEKAYWKGYIQKQKEAEEICKQCKYIKKARKLENELDQLNAYILINGIDETLKTATQIKVKNQHEYLHQKEIERLKSIIAYLESREQKLIEKLEKDIKNDFTINEHIVSNGVTLGTRTTHVDTYATEILEILKGKNDELSSKSKSTEME